MTNKYSILQNCIFWTRTERRSLNLKLTYNILSISQFLDWEHSSLQNHKWPNDLYYYPTPITFVVSLHLRFEQRHFGLYTMRRSIKKLHTWVYEWTIETPTHPPTHTHNVISSHVIVCLILDMRNESRQDVHWIYFAINILIFFIWDKPPTRNCSQKLLQKWHKRFLQKFQFQKLQNDTSSLAELFI